MKAVWYKLVALTTDGKTIPIGISDMNHTIGITLGADEVHMNEEQASALLNYVSTFFNVFKHIRLIRVEDTIDDTTFNIIKEITL
jgi:hypothetical protein